MPLVLFFSHGGWPTAVAAFVMICFHLGIFTAFPMGVPLEWNVFMIFGVLWVFVAHASIGLTDLTNPLPVALLFVVMVTVVTIGNLFPRKVSFLPGMRYYAGNWDTTLWCVKPSADERIERGARALAKMQHRELEKLNGSKEATLVPSAPRVRAPRHEHAWTRAVHAGAPRHGRARRSGLQPVRGRTDVRHGGRVALRRRAHAQRAADRRPTRAVRVRTR